MLAGVLLGGPLWAQAQVPSTPQPFVEQQRQQERERALREQNERTVDQRLQAALPAPTQRIPESESPCFRIDRVLLVGEQAEAFQWAVADLSGPEGNDSPLGRCLGTAGVNVVLARAQQAAIARGFVTTRVLTAPQDLSTGTLTLSLIPGRIAAIRLTPDSSSTLLGNSALLTTAIPARVGDLLNLRDIEQGLENLKRAPTAEADIQIEPSTAVGAKPGDSDLVVKYVQSKKWRVTLSLDDSGTKATGRNQAGATVSLDNPFGLNDLFYVSANHSVNSHFLSEPSYGTEGQTAHYSLPFGYWMLGFTASNSQYHQSVAGLNGDIVYAGKTNNAEVKLSRLLYRDQSRKTTVAVKGWRRESRNFVDDTEVEVQHRVVGGWEFSLNHKEFIGEATLEGTLAYKRGTGGFGSRVAPEEEFGEGTSRLKLYTADVTLNAPFKLGEQKLRYSGLIRAQWNRTPLTPQDRFAIGGRYTVRGFDGETSLLGERGMLIRNDIGWAMGQSGAELYAGMDYGHVGGRSTVDLLGRSLAGAVVGVRGQWSRLSYDFFVGAPIRKPEGYRTAKVTLGFNLNVSF
ncbi:ShlB/FhaC/HecB family hemolysin secretion/activation protein [Variovorax paradoxus]|uniref:Polypeptide-transport-associated domain protein ShlB-type n=1 Tax=Variovorax paradoxus (strain EPS) TaxID=595537 RepID=E6V3Y5_VARPE|nr:ShlB/FhaC/HecB family hemolysin secretion/activation protein [Variovorax paradoxus]ADU38104.1 Polypeptide-transport-associated domain protein ShlB-type [Variovorax paradoxus EPS]